MSRPIRLWSKGRALALLCFIGFVALGLGLTVSLLGEQQPPALRMSAGPESTRRHAIATYFREKAARNDLSVELGPTAGSEDCLNRLRDGSLDVAVVNNGVVVPDAKEVTVLGVLQPEVVHVLVRRELTGTAPLGERIRGKRVNLGEPGSTDWLLARDLLAFGRLKLPAADQAGDIVPTEYGKTDLANKARAILSADGRNKPALIADLPDCLLVVASVPSTVVQLLVEAADYRIEPLPGVRAFLADNMQDDNAKATIIDREFLEPATLPAGTYFTTRGFPDADCETLGLRLLFVARKGVPDRAIRPLMETLFEREFAHLTQPKSPRDVATPYAIHPAAIAYLDRDKPLPVKAAMEWVSQSLSIFGAFSAGALSLYGLVRWKKGRKPADYFAEIRRVEQLANSGGVGAGEPVADLDVRLTKLRQELIEDICAGRIKGDHVIANILTLLKEVRSNLPQPEETHSNPQTVRVRVAATHAA
jgi:TRAP-type uncharacterized transport system substrate-binding protein